MTQAVQPDLGNPYNFRVIVFCFVFRVARMLLVIKLYEERKWSFVGGEENVRRGGVKLSLKGRDMVT